MILGYQSKFSEAMGQVNKQHFGPCSGGCNTAIGGEGQSGFMRPVCRRSLSELRISVRIKLKDAATLSWMRLVKTGPA